MPSTRYTVVYVSDDGWPSCYGTFGTREAAQRQCERMERSVDDDRDIAGGGVGLFAACQIQPVKAWAD